MGAQNLFLLRLALIKRKKIIVGLIYRHPRMPVNDFCDNLLIECLNKIALLDNTCILFFSRP